MSKEEPGDGIVGLTLSLAVLVFVTYAVWTEYGATAGVVALGVLGALHDIKHRMPPRS